MKIRDLRSTNETSTDALVDQGLRIAHARMEKAERKNAEYAGTLLAAQALRPILLKQYGAVPECVLNYCNAARAVLHSNDGPTQSHKLPDAGKMITPRTDARIKSHAASCGIGELAEHYNDLLDFARDMEIENARLKTALAKSCDDQRDDPELFLCERANKAEKNVAIFKEALEHLISEGSPEGDARAKDHACAVLAKVST